MKKILLALFILSPLSTFAYFGQPYGGDLQYTLPYGGKNNATIFPNGDGTYTAIYHGSAGAEFGRNTTGQGEFPFGGSIEFTINADGTFTQGATKTGTAQFTYPAELDSADIVSTYGFYFWNSPEPAEYINPYQPSAEDWYSSSPAWTAWTPTPPPTCPEGYTGTYPDCIPPAPEMNIPMQYGLNLILIAIGLWFGYSFTRATVNVTGKGLAEARSVRKETKELKKKREKGLL